MKRTALLITFVQLQKAFVISHESLAPVIKLKGCNYAYKAFFFSVLFFFCFTLLAMTEYELSTVGKQYTTAHRVYIGK